MKGSRSRPGRFRWRCGSSHPVVFRMYGPGFRVQGAGCRVQGSGFRVQGAGFRVQGSGSRVQSSGSRVQVSGFRALHPGPEAPALGRVGLKCLDDFLGGAAPRISCVVARERIQQHLVFQGIGSRKSILGDGTTEIDPQSAALRC